MTRHAFAIAVGLAAAGCGGIPKDTALRLDPAGQTGVAVAGLAVMQFPPPLLGFEAGAAYTEIRLVYENVSNPDAPNLIFLREHNQLCVTFESGACNMREPAYDAREASPGVYRLIQTVTLSPTSVFLSTQREPRYTRTPQNLDISFELKPGQINYAGDIYIAADFNIQSQESKFFPFFGETTTRYLRPAGRHDSRPSSARSALVENFPNLNGDIVYTGFDTSNSSETRRSATATAASPRQSASTKGVVAYLFSYRREDSARNRIAELRKDFPDYRFEAQEALSGGAPAWHVHVPTRDVREGQAVCAALRSQADRCRVLQF